MEDLNKSQPVTDDTDLNKAPAVTEQDLNQPVTEKLADGDEKDKKTVKYTEFEKANEAKKKAEEEAALLRQQLALASANQPVVTQPAQPKDPYSQAMEELGFAGMDYITEQERSKVFQRAIEIQNAKHQQETLVQQNQRYIAGHPDYYDVVGRFIGNQFQPSAELTRILTEKPWMQAAAYSSAQAAYEIVMEQKQIDKLQKDNEINEEHLNQEEIQNKLAPVSGAAAAGGAISNNAGSVTYQQQLEMEERVARGEFNKKG